MGQNRIGSLCTELICKKTNFSIVKLNQLAASCQPRILLVLPFAEICILHLRASSQMFEISPSLFSHRQGKVSTPRIESEKSSGATSKKFLKPPQPPLAADDKKSCFGFDDDDDNDVCNDSDASQASIGGGCVTLSEISPVKRSSMLPPSHFISMVASPSSSTLSVTGEFAKPLSARFANLSYYLDSGRCLLIVVI